MNSPADIFAKYLIDQAVAIDPIASPGSAWTIYIGQIPDKPNNAIGAFDGKTRKDGRLMVGKTIFHPMVQILVRSHDYRTAYDKAHAIKELIELIDDVTVNLQSTDYVIKAASLKTDVLSLGMEQDKNRRHMMSVNFSITLSN